MTTRQVGARHTIKACRSKNMEFFSTLLHLPPSDSTVSEDAGIELFRLLHRQSGAINYLARSHPQCIGVKLLGPLVLQSNYTLF
jgi:hypothetical protein